MTHLNDELEQLVNGVISMTDLTIKQIVGTREAYLTSDIDLAEEVMNRETRVNAMELSLDRECENILALFNPVASDLRLVIAVIKIIADLERIGDYAHDIANYVKEDSESLNAALKEETGIEKMFDRVISMLEDIKIAIDQEDTKLARKVYQKDKKLNKTTIESIHVIKEHVHRDQSLLNQGLFMFSTLRKLERAGDHIKNIAENLIFYVEVINFRHKKM